MNHYTRSCIYCPFVTTVQCTQEPKKAAKRDEVDETSSEEAARSDDNLKTKNINIFRFKQQSVTEFFKSTRVIEWDEEVRKLEKEQRLELKRRGELR